MTVVKACGLLIVLAFASALVLALVSRAPEQLREAEPARDATDASHGARFSDDDVARHAAYRGPAYLSFALQVVLQIVTLIVLARVVVPRVLDAIATWPGGWLTKVAVATLVVVVTMTLVSLPVSYVRGFQIEHAWGLSTQSTIAWVNDQGRALAVGLITAVIPALAFFGLVRAFPRAWPVWGWAVFTLFGVLFAFLWPILVAPLFNKFTPLEAGPLRDRIVQLGDDAGVNLDDVLVADASKRTTAENAYVAGVGASKRMVLYDTLLDAGNADETSYVAAHELGHEVHDHIWKFVGLTSLSLAAGFAVLKWLSSRADLWAWAAADSIADPRALPLLVLLTVVATLVFLPVQNGISRSFEREADRVAISLTHDPDTAVRVYRRLAFSNLADLRPPQIAEWLLFTHPPIPERIGNVQSAAENRDSS